MQFEHEIVPEIEAIVDSKYSDWCIGISDNASLRSKQLHNPAIWYEWKAVTAEAAKNITKHFFSKGMKLDVCLGSNPRDVYIFVPSKPD